MKADVRLEDRRAIVAAANRRRRSSNVGLLAMAHSTGKPLNLNGPFTMKSLQRAVCVCRRNGLVPDRTLEGAGFRARA